MSKSLDSVDWVDRTTLPSRQLSFQVTLLDVWCAEEATCGRLTRHQEAWLRERIDALRRVEAAFQ